MAGISGTFDRAKLERSLKRASKAFGDTSAQAIARWGVGTCRELAKDTQVFGNTAKSKKKQEDAMLADALKVIRVTNAQYKPRRGKANQLRSIEEVMDWIEINRTARHGRTAKLETFEKKECEEKLFLRAMKVRYKLAGIAKGGWIGAGKDIAKRQQGTDRINIGVNWARHAHAHENLGSSTLQKSTFDPFALLKNGARHTVSKHVMRRGAEQNAANWALKKTLTWYRKSLKANLEK